MNILFVCSQNKWRSRTAEDIFKNNGLHQIRSAGTKRTARIRINQKLIDWSDIILVMEKSHKSFLIDNYRNIPRLNVLDIPDEYQYMNPELIEILKLKTEDVMNGQTDLSKF